ncbi:LysE family translocator [Novosphingobium cyanobacteriorum]|uniref:LysE family translocator n=1 Tax=Novosphingobium cyanobacteriorum TaxID=3024215 RepID=A0ABT6CIY8_9SPHN|nr:LysE family translocator [Novosphingobium cyanobacteriorum]MDF8333880.1 LysE family translocator [Novosphingobium cyanobacteriorum]
MALHTWWLFVVTVFFVSASPGPNMLHVMARSVELGLGRSVLAMAGCFVAVSSLLTASAMGLTALLMAIPGAFTVLRYAGAAYLVWLGYKSWVAQDAPIDIGEGEVRPGVSPLRIFSTAFMIGISNPKALLFAAAFLPQFIDPARPQVPQFAIMVGTFAVIEISWYFVYAVGGRSIAGFLERPAPRKAFNRLTGAIFVAFGLAMAGSRA